MEDLTWDFTSNGNITHKTYSEQTMVDNCLYRFSQI